MLGKKIRREVNAAVAMRFTEIRNRANRRKLLHNEKP